VSRVEPDLAGFAAAQERHRELFGEDVLFLFAATEEWPAGTPLDPESGRPYDPTVEAVASAQASAVVRCNVAYRGGLVDDARFEAVGVFEASDVLCIAPSAAASAIEPAVSFVARGERWQLTRTMFDGVAGVQRLLVYGRLAS
jgi:hypothetical protein